MAEVLVVLFDRDEGRVEYYLVPDEDATAPVLDLLASIASEERELDPGALRAELDPFRAGYGLGHEMVCHLRVTTVVSLII